MQAEPRQIAIEILGILFVGKITVGQSPIRNRSRHTMDDLPNAALALLGPVLAIEVLAHYYVGRQLTPRRRNFTVVLLEECLAAFVLDGCGAQFPRHGVEGVLDLGGTKRGLDADGGGRTV